MNFEVLWLFAKLGDMAYLAAPASNLLEFSSRKSYLPPIHETFLLQKFPTITVGCLPLYFNSVVGLGI